VGIYKQLEEIFRKREMQANENHGVNSDAAQELDTPPHKEKWAKTQQWPERIEPRTKFTTTPFATDVLGCSGCGYFWKGWCAYEAPTSRNVEFMNTCPRPEDVEMLSPGLAERYSKEPPHLCRDCLVRTNCSRFIGLAWFFPGCPDFQNVN
jgi:hypothetical protein